MNGLLWLVCGVLLAEAAQWLIRFWRQGDDRQRRAKATQVLKTHGLTPQLFLATIGEDDAGEVVGKLCPRAEEGPHLRLIVSNS